MTEDHISDKFIKRTELYKKDYKKYGYSPLALSMPSDRRNIRYYELFKHCYFINENPIIFDAGCGFGDANKYLFDIGVREYSYIGVDVVDDFIQEARKRYSDNKKVRFELMDFRSEDISHFQFDWAILSQVFNFPYGTDKENTENLKNSIVKIFSQCSERGGVSFNFFNCNVDWKTAETAYYDPCEILRFAFSLSRNVILDNSCMPFETTITIFKNDTFDAQIFEPFLL